MAHETVTPRKFRFSQPPPAQPRSWLVRGLLSRLTTWTGPTGSPGHTAGRGACRGPPYRGSWGGPLCSSRWNSQLWLANCAYSSSPLTGFFSWHSVSFL